MCTYRLKRKRKLNIIKKTIEILKKLYIIIGFPFPFPKAFHHPLPTCRPSYCTKLPALSAPRPRPPRGCSRCGYVFFFFKQKQKLWESAPGRNNQECIFCDVVGTPNPDTEPKLKTRRLVKETNCVSLQVHAAMT